MPDNVTNVPVRECRLSFGARGRGAHSANLPILINMNSWKKLTKEEQGILLTAGEMTELQMPWIGDKLQAEEDAALAKLGVKITNVPADQVAAMKKAFSDSVWGLGEKCCGDAAKKLRELAVKAGLSP